MPDYLNSTFYRRPEIRLSISQKIRRVNWVLVVLVCMLATTGVVMLYSVAGGTFQPWAEQHILRFVAGLALLFTVALVDIKIWYKLAWPIFILSLGLLILVPFFGSINGGARRWLDLGLFSIQPSELIKISLILVLARFYQDISASQKSSLANLAIVILLIMIPTILVFSQPDLGTSLLILGVGTGIMFIAGVNLYYFLGAALAIGSAIPVLLSNLQNYQKERILTFLNPERDPLGTGYHILQSKIAIGSGGVHGRGLVNGSQSQLNFLPEKHTDFIFTMLAEELGFFGASGLLLLFVLTLLTLWFMVFRVKSVFAKLIISGSLLNLFYYVFVNIGMVMGLLPVVGVPLPLVSYGGTSMLSLLLSLGLSMSAFVHFETEFAKSNRYL